MGKFFAFDSDGQGKIYYFKGPERKRILKGELNYTADSHTSVADYHGFKGRLGDGLNKMEYNPLTDKLHIDQLNADNDTNQVLAECRRLNFKELVPELVIHPIVDPLVLKRTDVTEEEKDMLKDWMDIKDTSKVWDHARLVAGATVAMTVGVSISDTIGASIRGGTWDKIWNKVSAAYWAYFASFFEDIKDKYKVGADLWNRGLVAGNGTLRGGFDGEILYEKNTTN